MSIVNINVLATNQQDNNLQQNMLLGRCTLKIKQFDKMSKDP